MTCPSLHPLNRYTIDGLDYFRFCPAQTLYLIPLETWKMVAEEDILALYSAYGSAKKLEPVLKRLGPGPHTEIRKGYGRTLLHEFAMQGDVDGAKIMLQYGADPNATDCCGSTPLDTALLRKTPEYMAVADILECHGGKKSARAPGAPEPDDYFHFWNSADNGKIEGLKKFIDKFGVKEIDRQSYGKSALYKAVHNDHHDAAEYLLKQGASPDARDGQMASVLYEAAISSSPAMLRLLIGHGADLNAADVDGVTALMTCAAWSWYDQVNILLQAGARLDLKHDEGETAYDMARATKREDIICLFETEMHKRKMQTIRDMPQGAPAGVIPLPRLQVRRRAP